MTNVIESIVDIIYNFIEFVQVERRTILWTSFTVIVVSLLMGVAIQLNQDDVIMEEPAIEEPIIEAPINETQIIDEVSTDIPPIEEPAIVNMSEEQQIEYEEIRGDMLLEYRDTWEGETLEWFIDEGYDVEWDDATFLKWMKGVSDEVLMGSDVNGLVV